MYSSDWNSECDSDPSLPTQVRQADFLVEGEVGGGEDFGLPLLGMAVLTTLFNTGHRDFGKDQSMLVNSAWQHLLYTRVVLQSWSWPEPAGAGTFWLELV